MLANAELNLKPAELGDEIYRITDNARGVLFNVGRLMQLAHEAFFWTGDNVLKGGEPSQKLPFRYPLGLRPDGTSIVGTTEYTRSDLHNHFVHLRERELPLTVIYHIVTHIEAWLADIIRAIVCTYPQKVGKKTIEISRLLRCQTVEAIHLAAADSILYDLGYKSPRDFANQAEQILGTNLLEVPAYHAYIEVKATRDIYIHNRGIANELYIEKAGSRARVRENIYLPVTREYMLSAYEAALQLLDVVESTLLSTWTSPAFEAYKASSAEEAKSEKEAGLADSKPDEGISGTDGTTAS